MLPALKTAERPWLRRLVERRGRAGGGARPAATRRSRRGATRSRCSPQRGASPLFLLRHGERRRIEWRGEDRLRPARPGGRRRHRRGAACAIDRRESRRRLPRRARPAGDPGRRARHRPPGGGPGRALLHGAGGGHPRGAGGGAAVVALRPQTLVLESQAGRSGWRSWGSPSPPCWATAGRSTAGWPSATAAIWWPRSGSRSRRRSPSCAARPWPPIPASSGRSRRRGSRSSTPSTSSARRRSAAAARKNEVVGRRVQQLRDACRALGQAPGADRLLGRTIRASTARTSLESYWEQMELDAVHLQVIIPT